MAKGKKYSDALKRFDREMLFGLEEGLSLAKSLSEAAGRGFDETVEVAVRLGVDPRKADQMVRGTVALPSGTGKDVRIAVFAAGEAANEDTEIIKSSRIKRMREDNLEKRTNTRRAWA